VTPKDYAGPEHFASAAKRRYHEEEIPSLGWIRVQNLSEREQSEWETAKIGDDGRRTTDGLRETKAHLIVLCLVDDEGDRRFHDSQVGVVMEADSAVTNAVFEICRRHCGIPTKDVDAVAALRAIQKNSEGGPG
jgi:hypothetical protein